MSDQPLKDSFNEESKGMLEESLKELLEKILTYMEKFIKTKEDLREIEAKLNDYDNLNALVNIIQSIFAHLTAKIDESLSKAEKTQNKDNSNSNEDYDQLEKILQKHEAEIRIHIRSNQTMKLFQESLQSKLEESEQSRTQLLEGTKNMMNEIKKQNNELSEKLSKLEAENSLLNKKIKESNNNEKILEEKLHNVPFLEEKIQSLEKIVKDNMQEKYLTASMQNLSKENTLKKLIPDFDPRKIKKPESPPISSLILTGAVSRTGGVHSTSPSKVERKIQTPNLINSIVKENSIKSSYQRFYNNFKLVKEDSKDLRTLTTFPTNPSQPKNGINQLIQSTVREKDSAKTLNSHGNSMSNSHNNSFICNNSGSNSNFKSATNTNHKRTKSHQIPKMRGIINGNVINTKNITDYSRLSNQDISDLQINQYYNK